MIRTLPPRGRAVGVVLLAAVALSLLVAVPAAAAGELSVSVPPTVTGRDALRLTPSGLQAPVPLDITITDSDGAVATWHYSPRAVGDDTPLEIDLAAPDSGSAPRNGAARIAVSGPAGVAAKATTTIDRSPPTPSLRTVVRGQRVGVTWDAVAAPDPVTYKLERIVTGGAWTVVESSQSADGFTDRGLEPGRYRYRLTAGVPSADGGMNWSTPTATQLKIAAPAPRPSVTPPPPKPTADANAEQPDAPAQPKPDTKGVPEPRRQERPRNVAATGSVRGPVETEDTSAPQLQTNPTPLIATADEPAVDGAAPPLTTDVADVATPEVAAPAAAPAQEASPSEAPPAQPFPAYVPPAGSLTVAAATRTPPDPVSLFSGLVFLLLAAGVVARMRRRTGRAIIPAWVGRR